VNRKSFKPHALAAALIVAMAPMGSALAADGARVVNKAAVESGAEFSGFIVKFRDGTAERAVPTMVARSLQGVDAMMAKSSRGAPGLRHFRRMGLGADVVRASRKLSAAEAVQAMEQLAAMPGVEYVEPDLIMRPALTPNDPRYNEQWGFFSATAGIRANTAWDVATGTGIIVAVLDTGQATHSDMTGNLVAGYDFISSTTVANDGGGRDSNPADPGDWTTGQCGPAQGSSWHGTHVAGTVAARTNNGVGVAGTAFNAKVMPVRTLGTCGGSTSDIADAIIWSSGGTVSGVTTLTASQKAHVINMSLGGSGSCGTTTQNAINGAVSRGTTVVVAAGNSNANAANFTPASCANVINVASITSSGARSSFSNFGTSIDVSAPGSGILSTLNSGSTTPGSESYASYSGTSMAAPHVAGTVALVQSRRLALGLPLYTPAEVESLLKSTAYPLPGACSGGCGAGIINARAAVDAAGGGGGGGTPPTTQTYSNMADYQIRDNATVSSPITVSGRSGNAPSATTISVDIRHTYIGDLKVDLVAPDGSVYVLHNRSGGSADNIIRSYTVNLSSEALNGTWNLRVNDNANADTGFINSWSVTF
jgi:serine protease